MVFLRRVLWLALRLAARGARWFLWLMPLRGGTRMAEMWLRDGSRSACVLVKSLRRLESLGREPERMSALRRLKKLLSRTSIVEALAAILCDRSRWG